MVRLRRDLITHSSGGWRSIPPEETLSATAALRREAQVTRIADVTGLDCIGIPVTMVIRPLARSVCVSQGKGATLEAARTSGVMESLEAWFAEEFRGPVYFDSYRSVLDKHDVVAVDRLPMRAGVCLDHDERILWASARRVHSPRELLVPFECVTLDFSLPAPPGFGTFLASSNGLASGNTLAEALLHGICELIERDARATRHRSHARERAPIDLQTVEDPQCSRLLDQLYSAGMDVQALDLTSDLAVPCIEAHIDDSDSPGSRELGRFTGAGCHPDATIALHRALVEAAQARLTIIAAARDDLPPELYFQSGRTSALAQGDRPRATTPFEPPPLRCTTIEEAVDWLVQRFADAGLPEPLYCDLTADRAELPIRVVKVLAPGLEGMDHAREYAPGARAAG